jgi:hypothetical protein
MQMENRVRLQPAACRSKLLDPDDRGNMFFKSIRLTTFLQ